MYTGAIAFLCGVLLFQFAPDLPGRGWLLLWIPTLPAVFLLRAPWHAPAAVLAGVLWALLHAHWGLSSELSADLEGEDLLVEGRIASLPEPRQRAVRFVFEIDSLRHAGAARPAPRRVRLSWYQPSPPLVVGERWRLRIRLKRPHGYQNPAGFDYEAWLLRQGIRATGYVRQAEENRRLAAAPASVERWRQQLSEQMEASLPEQPMRGVLAALVIGERSGIDPAQWQVLNRTGTSHLVAISGLHIGLVAGLVFFLARWIWARSASLTLRLPAQRAAAVVAASAALGYAAMAGFSLPTQRALMMVAVVMAAIFWQRTARAARSLSLALIAVLLLEPLGVLAPGFWLSFGAVAIILYAMGGRLSRGTWASQWGRVQWVIAVGLFPALIVFFQQASLVAPLANLLAVPVVSFLVVPPVLLGAVALIPFPAVGTLVLGLAGQIMGWLWQALAWFSELPVATWTGTASAAALAAAALGAVVLLAPRGLAGRWVGAVLCLPLLLADPPRPAAGEAWFTLLDVGQGLAATIRTREHVLVYDTGPRYGEHFDTGAAVVAPFLRAQGVRALDRLVISHGDNDHRGGTASLLEAIPARDVLSADPARLPVPARPCTAGEQWVWDGVSFSLLHPPQGLAGETGNDRSCVLRVEAGGDVLLLTGDIERAAEGRLLSTGASLAADVLVAPHHGSLTSSGEEFVRAVDPGYVLFPVGYRNRWGFPRPPVVERYRERGAVLLDTARHGAIGFRLGAGGEDLAPRLQRREGRRYWHQD